MKNKRQRGITLIALVITIIVLIILAAVSIETLTGENGILTQAGNAKEETIISREKESIIQAWNAVFLNKQSEDEINDTELEDELKKIGEKNVSVTGENILIITYRDTGHKYKMSKSTKSIEQVSEEEENKIKEMVDGDERLFILNEGGELSYVNCEGIDSDQFIEVDISKKTPICDNVKELYYNGSYLTYNDELYIFYNNQYKKASNVKKIYPQEDFAYISKENELIFFDWGSGTYNNYADNVKEYFGNYSYSTTDGNAIIRLYSNGSIITIEKDISYCYDGYYLTNDGSLYKENTNVIGEFNKVADNVKEIDKYACWYLSNNEELFEEIDGQFFKTAENVKKVLANYYISNNNELFKKDNDVFSKKADNVKEYDIEDNMYISDDNKLFIGDDNNFIESGYEISNYGINSNVWFETKENKVYYYYKVPKIA